MVPVTAPVGESLGDATLLERVANQDRLAFRTFYDRHSGRALAVLRQLTRNDDLADDLLQEVFLLVWRKAASFRPDRGDVGGWLYTICRHRVADHFRAAPRVRRLETDEVVTLPAPTVGVEDETRLSLEQALSRLSVDQRKAVALAYFGGLTYEETAERLAVPLGTLKSRVRAALARLRGALGNEPS